jgi:hypothetical protein
MVIRLGPVDEGMVGKLAPTDGHETIARRWGGGKYKCVARDGKGKPIKGGFETIEIAGEPIFKSKGAELEYKRQIGEDTRAPATAAVASTAPTSMDIVAILSRQADEQRAAFERRQLEAEAQHKRDMDRIREEAGIRERERAAADERRERERKEDEERRRKEEIDREAREKRYADEARMRDRQFFEAMQKQAGSKDPTESLMLGIKLATDLRGGDEDRSPWAAALAPIAGAIAKAAQSAQAGRTEAAPALPARAAPAAAAPAKPAAKKAEGVTLEGELAIKAKSTIEKIKAIGANPETIFAGMLDELGRRADAEAEKMAAAKAADAPAPAPPPDPAAKVTEEPKPGTP